MTTYQYSQEYYPPAPILEVSFIMAAEFLRVGPLLALVDSGADGTIVPIKYLEEIHAPSTTEMTIRSQWGERHSVLLYLVDIQIDNLTLPGIEVVGDELADDVIIGRDVLNRLQILLNGPKRITQVME